MEAEVGIEPAYTDLQSDQEPLKINDLSSFQFRNNDFLGGLQARKIKGCGFRCGTVFGLFSPSLLFPVRVPPLPFLRHPVPMSGDA